MKKQYGGKVTMIQDMYPSWTDADVVYALNECDGDLELTVERITDGKQKLHFQCYHLAAIHWLLRRMCQWAVELTHS